MEVLGFMMYRGVVNFAESIEKIPQNFREIRPEVFITVPRLLEKVHSKIMSGVESGGGVKKGLFSWAMRVGGKVCRAKMEKRSVPAGLALQFRHIALRDVPGRGEVNAEIAMDQNVAESADTSPLDLRVPDLHAFRDALG